MKKYLRKSSEKGIASILVVFLLLGGIILGVVLTFRQQIFNPRASVDSEYIFLYIKDTEEPLSGSRPEIGTEINFALVNPFENEESYSQARSDEESDIAVGTRPTTVITNEKLNVCADSGTEKNGRQVYKLEEFNNTEDKGPDYTCEGWQQDNTNCGSQWYRYSKCILADPAEGNVKSHLRPIDSSDANSNRLGKVYISENFSSESEARSTSGVWCEGEAVEGCKSYKVAGSDGRYMKLALEASDQSSFVKQPWVITTPSNPLCVKFVADSNRSVIECKSLGEDKSSEITAQGLNNENNLKRIQVIFKEGKGPGSSEFSDSSKRLINLGVNVQGVEENITTSESLKNYYALTVKSGFNLEKVLNDLSKDPSIEWVGPDYQIKFDSEPNDPEYRSGNQWHLKKIGMPFTWDKPLGGGKVVIAFLDTGFNDHPDVESSRIYSRVNTINDELTSDVTDNYGHGTSVAGIVMAHTDNNNGIAGMGWGVDVSTIKAAIYKVVDSSGTTDGSSSVIKAIDDIINRRRQGESISVVNMSFSFLDINGNPVSVCPTPMLNAVREARNQLGIVFIGIAGNSNNGAPNIPGGCEGVIDVGGTNNSDERYNTGTYGSNFSERIDVSAPAQDLVTINNNRGYNYNAQGTSFAAPQVAYAVAMLLSADSRLTPQRVLECIKGTSDPVNSREPIGGRLNVNNILSSINKPPCKP